MKASLRQVAGELRLQGTSSNDFKFDSMSADSRRIRPDGLFVAIAGPTVDGHDFLAQAVANGAGAVVVEDGSRAEGLDLPVFITDDGRALVARLARALSGEPDRELDLVAITGTNGKTTVAHLVQSLLSLSGRPCGMFGTIRYDLVSHSIPAPLTTPGVEEFFPYLREMVEAGAQACAMEASSHALDQQRLGEAEVKVAAFTNIGRDHLDYHGTTENYLAAKLRLLDRLGEDAVAVANMDDSVLASVRWPKGTVRVGRGEGATVRLLDSRCDRLGSELHLRTPDRELRLKAPLLGPYNVENLLLLAGIAHALELDADRWAELFAVLPPVEGRLEGVQLAGGPLVLVDYAHTPDGIRAALVACRELLGESGKVRIVFGCGGERDRGKRPLMVSAAAELADELFLTTDNPRGESLTQIFEDMKSGIPVDGPPVATVEDRGEAIREALVHSAPEDCLLLAGKGHERYQILVDGSHDWDDREAARRAWQREEEA